MKAINQSAQIVWLPPPKHLPLLRGQVHVWRSALDVTDECLESLSQILTEDEFKRAERFRFETARRRFIVTRSVLKHILGHYLESDPAHLQFIYDKNGKPALHQQPGEDDIRFNLSHSGEFALYAVTRGQEVGIDIEFVFRDKPDFRIAEKFFDKKVVEALRSLPTEAQSVAFHIHWTRLEAYLKALGFGLAGYYHVLLVDSQGPMFSSQGFVSDLFEHNNFWRFESFIPAPNYMAAVVSKGQNWQLSFWQCCPNWNATEMA